MSAPRDAVLLLLILTQINYTGKMPRERRSANRLNCGSRFCFYAHIFAARAANVTR